jgi:endonuclease III related protein
MLESEINVSISRRELIRLYRRLYRHYGDLHWWPAKTPFEVSVGAILTQNTAWKNVEKAIRQLTRAGALSVGALSKMSHQRLARLIKSAGYFNVKARRLKNFISFVAKRYRGSPAQMCRQETDRLRAELLALNGIGPETADSILLYAAEKPVFVIDAYTKRILSRHGVLAYEKSYDDFQTFFTKRLPRDAALYNQFHAMLVKVGNEFCRSQPRCDECPLKSWRGVP